MAGKFSQRLVSLSAGDISAVIQMAWEDRTSFDTIKERVTKHRALRSPEMKFNDRCVADHRRANV